jgi:hypothetical protein
MNGLDFVVTVSFGSRPAMTLPSPDILQIEGVATLAAPCRQASIGEGQW